MYLPTLTRTAPYERGRTQHEGVSRKTFCQTVKAHYRHKFDLEYHGELKETRLRKCQVEDGESVNNTVFSTQRGWGRRGIPNLLVVADDSCVLWHRISGSSDYAIARKRHQFPQVHSRSSEEVVGAGSHQTDPVGFPAGGDCDNTLSKQCTTFPITDRDISKCPGASDSSTGSPLAPEG